jgi:hypothetical protein
MTDVLPKPFTKDSLLGMLEKYLSKMKLTQHMQQQFELGYGIPAALKPQRVVELLPEETEQQQEPQRQQHQQSQQTSPVAAPTTLTDPLVLDDQNAQFSYHPDYLYNVPAFPAQQPQSGTKRRSASDLDSFDYLDHTRVPRSTGNVPPAQNKRPRYNTPPW